MAVLCTKTSLPPFSGVINPNPLPSLKNFTVPFAICLLFFLFSACCSRRLASLLGPFPSLLRLHPLSGDPGSLLAQTREIFRQLRLVHASASIPSMPRLVHKATFIK